MSSFPQPLTPGSRATSCSVSSLMCLQIASKSDVLPINSSTYLKFYMNQMLSARITHHSLPLCRVLSAGLSSAGQYSQHLREAANKTTSTCGII